jgi:hypothetical protein
MLGMGNSRFINTFSFILGVLAPLVLSAICVCIISDDRTYLKKSSVTKLLSISRTSSSDEQIISSKSVLLIQYLFR